MQYRLFGRTGVKASALGFGCMRLPMRDGRVDRDLSTPLLRRAVELGVNYFDTGKAYCNQDSESALGDGLRGLDRSKFYISTKYAQEHHTAADLREKFEASLKLLGVDYIDFYHFWGISWESFQTRLAVKGGPLDEFLKLKDEGLVRHLSFSFHSQQPQDMQRLVDTGYFESVLCQYNLLDRSNEEGLAYAAGKGLGVAVMGPVGGGRLGGPSGILRSLLGRERRVSTPELALRFVLANRNIAVALSGMSDLKQVVENAATAAQSVYLGPREHADVKLALEENRKLAQLYCTGCQYCMPCPNEVNIARVFELMNYDRVYGLAETARQGYQELREGKGWHKGKAADACLECGECEPKCPQKIQIVKQLAESHAALVG